uniref:Uncharacterized protein n=1 Tax=Ciona savignyi TaxID=51511 RepID=H2YYF8_CIOSA
MTSSIRIDDDLIEVTLDDDGSTPSGEFVELPCIMDNRPGTPYESVESDFSESSTEIDPVTKPPLPNKKLIRHMPSKSDTGIKPLQNIQKREMESYITTHFIEISFPWAEVTSSLSTLRFTRSLEFTHAWNYYGADKRLLVVTVDNVTSQTIRLRDPSLLLLNSSRVETTQLFSSKEKTIKAGSNMVCAWKVNGSTHFSSIINAQFVVDVVSSCDVTDDVMSPGDDVIVSKATYKFELDNIQ